MKCTYCGEENEIGNKICTKCGNDLSGECIANNDVGRKAPWNPNAIKYIAIFCSMIPGAILFSINYKRLGHPKSKSRIILVIGITILFFILAYLTPANQFINYLFYGANIGIAIYFANDQKSLFGTYLQSGGKKNSIILPLILSIVFIVLMIFILILASITENSYA